MKGFLFQFADSLLGLHFFRMQTIFTLHLFLKAILKPHLRLLLISKISTTIFIPWTSKNFVKSKLVNHPYLERNLNLLKLVVEVFPPRRSGTLRASLCEHQQICNCHICPPRIPHALCLCGFSHRLLQYDVRGANSLVCCHFHISCTLHHQWLLERNTLHR